MSSSSSSSRTSPNLNPSAIVDPRMVTPAMKKALTSDYPVDLKVQVRHEVNPMRSSEVIAATVPGKLLCAFSRAASGQLSGMDKDERRGMDLGMESPSAVKALVAYLYTVVATQGPLPVIFTKRLSWDDWLSMHSVAALLDMPLVVQQLSKQVPSDIRALDLAGTLTMWADARVRVGTPLRALEGKLWAYAHNKVENHETTLDDASLMDFDASGQGFTKQTAQNWADAHYRYDQKASDFVNAKQEPRLATNNIQTIVNSRWDSRRKYEQKKARLATERRHHYKEREAYAVYGANGKVYFDIGSH